MPLKPGDIAWVGNQRCVVVRQVLFNQPAYEVRCYYTAHKPKSPGDEPVYTAMGKDDKKHHREFLSASAHVVDHPYIASEQKHAVDMEKALRMLAQSTRIKKG